MTPHMGLANEFQRRDIPRLKLVDCATKYSKHPACAKTAKGYVQIDSPSLIRGTPCFYKDVQSGHLNWISAIPGWLEASVESSRNMDFDHMG